MSKPTPDPHDASTATEASAHELPLPGIDLSSPTSGQPVWGTISAPVAMPSPDVKGSDTSRKYGVEYNIDVHAHQTLMPEGLQRVLDILGQAIAPRPASPAGDNHVGSDEPAASTPTAPENEKGSP
ncbi:DUF2589 domain-containing protein [Pseudomonas otitidis]|uniref:DUF2589 domain-containing protein n=1 Tax=Metapseudomonas otitidis TaxID=319939 RepID=A0ABU3XTV7_9GAMM|nr:DUF2589 domain-containing protein [Pseudomonas otitidis]MDV3441368.1 DUF2589 domain-containing protein [Pseudomonas otitidis]WMR30496.1 DUF2589 domain-containing protein [Pseudomonas otitidis]